jgi:hypothetical protein
MNPTSLVCLHKLLLPSPRSHWSATRPRSKTQPTTTRHTQRKHTRPSWWHLKTVRPVSETGQTASVGLSLSTGRGNWSDRFGKPVRPVLSRNSPKHLRDQNTSRTFPPLNKRSHSTIETLLLKNPSRQPTGLKPVRRFGKPVRSVLPGQSGRTQPARKTQHSKRSISRFIPWIEVRLWE